MSGIIRAFLAVFGGLVALGAAYSALCELARKLDWKKGKPGTGLAKRGDGR